MARKRRRFIIKMKQEKKYKKVIDFNFNKYMLLRFGLELNSLMDTLAYPVAFILISIILFLLYPLFIFIVIYDYFKNRKIYYIKIK